MWCEWCVVCEWCVWRDTGLLCVGCLSVWVCGGVAEERHLQCVAVGLRVHAASQEPAICTHYTAQHNMYMYINIFGNSFPFLSFCCLVLEGFVLPSSSTCLHNVSVERRLSL